MAVKRSAAASEITTTDIATQQQRQIKLKIKELNVINIGNSEIQDFDDSKIYDFKDGKVKFQGIIYPLKDKWFLSTNWIRRFSPYTSNFSQELQVFVKSQKLSEALNHMAARVVFKMGRRFLIAYENPIEGAYAKISKKCKIYNEAKQDISDKFDWKMQQQKMKFLFEIFGFYVFPEKNSNNSLLKVVCKIIQCQQGVEAEGEGAEESDEDTYYDVCLF